jgi:SEC-C motif domain protein
VKRGAAVCPCGGLPAGSTWADCCGRWFDGGAWPDTAEQLMRSRYSAYVLGRADWLLATWAAATRPATIDLDVSQTTWLGLTVRGAHELDADHAEVEFIARSRNHGGAHPGRAERLHELSRFERIDGRWFYVDGGEPAA